jgi:hypothetical protein
MKTLISLCGICWIGLASLSAQEDARTVKFRVLCYEHAKETLKGFVMGAGGDKQEVEFFTGGFGPQLTGKFAGGKVRFYTEKPGPDGKPVRTVVGEGNLAASAVQMFLLLPENKTPGPVYRVMAFDDLEADFPMGSTRVINLAPFPIRLNLAGADLEPIKSGGMKVYPQVKVVDEWNMYQARIDFGVAADQWVPVATQSWKASDRKRDWVITHIDPVSQTPAIRLYQDVPPWREVALPIGGTGKKTPP